MENRFLPSIVEMASDFTDCWFVGFLLLLILFSQLSMPMSFRPENL